MNLTVNWNKCILRYIYIFFKILAKNIYILLNSFQNQNLFQILSLSVIDVNKLEYFGRNGKKSFGDILISFMSTEKSIKIFWWPRPVYAPPMGVGFPYSSGLLAASMTCQLHHGWKKGLTFIHLEGNGIIASSWLCKRYFSPSRVYLTKWGCSVPESRYLRLTENITYTSSEDSLAETVSNILSSTVISN